MSNKGPTNAEEVTVMLIINNVPCSSHHHVPSTDVQTLLSAI